MQEGWASAAACGGGRSHRALSVFYLEIARLRWGNGCKQAAFGLQVNKRGAVQAVKPSHQQPIAGARSEAGHRGADRIRPYWRTQGKGAARRLVVDRALPYEIAPGFMQPIQHFDAFKFFNPVKRLDPGSKRACVYTNGHGRRKGMR